MKKKIIIISIAVLSISAIVFGFSFAVKERNRTGFLIYSANESNLSNAVNIYDVRKNINRKIEADGYNAVRNVGKYYGGDFCCIGSSDNKNDILLFKDGSLEKVIRVPLKVNSAAIYIDTIYFLADGTIYSLQKNTGEYFQLLKDIFIFEENFVNSKGDILFFRKGADSSDYSDKQDLYLYSDSEEKFIGKVSDFLTWLSDDKIAVRVRDSVTTKPNSDSEVKKDNNSTFIVELSSNTWTQTDLFDNCDALAAVSDDGKKAVCLTGADGSTDYSYLGIIDIKSSFKDKKALTNEVLSPYYLPQTFLWVKENPFDGKYETNTISFKSANILNAFLID